MNKIRIIFTSLILMPVGFLSPGSVASQVLESSVLSERFLSNGDEVHDTLTGLVWRRCAEGQTWTGETCSGVVLTLTWQNALNWARSAASMDKLWRLPNVKELGSLADIGLFNPAIDPNAFPGATNTQFWTSTHSANNVSLVVAFYDGGAGFGSRDSSFAVRLVRNIK